MTKQELEDRYILLFQEVYSPQHFLKRFATLIDQIDLFEIALASPLTWGMRSRRKWDYLWAIFYMVHRYLIAGSLADRRFFLSLVKIALRKGWPALHLVYETLVFFISQQKFIQNLSAKRSLAFHTRDRLPKPHPPSMIHTG